MIERLKENGVETQIEKQAPQHEQQGAPNLGRVEMFISEEALAQESPSRQIIAGMYREDGNYEGVDTSEQEQALVKATRSSKYSAAKATKDEAFADYLGVEPAARVIREAAKEPLIDDQYNRARARIEEKVKNLKRQIADFNAEVESRYSKETAKIDKRYETIYNKETADLAEKFGPSFADRLEALNKQKAKEIGNKIVAKVSVDSTESEAKEEIAESNRSAAGVEVQDASDENLMTVGAAAIMLNEERDARNERIAEWQSEQEEAKTIEGREVERFDDVEIDAAVVEAVDDKPYYSEDRQELLEIAEAIEAKPRRRGIFGRAMDKMNKALIGFSNRNANKSPEQVKSRRRKVVAAGVGVLAVGVAAYLFKDHGHDFGLSGLFGQGHEGNANDAHQAMGGHTAGSHGVGTHGTEQVYGPSMPDHTTVTPSDVAPTPTPEVVANAPVTSPHIAQEVTLHPGQNVSDYVAGYINKAYPHASAQQVDSMIREGNAYMMYSNGYTMADTHNIVAGTNFDTSSLVSHFPGAK